MGVLLMETILYYLSDSAINAFLTFLVDDYKVMTALVGGPLIWYGRKIACRTPWTSDDAFVEALETRLGVKKPPENPQ